MKHLCRLLIREEDFDGHIVRGISISGKKMSNILLESSEEQLKNETLFLIVTSDRRGALSSSYIERRNITSEDFCEMTCMTKLIKENCDKWKSNFEERASTGRIGEIYTTFIIYRHSITNEQLAIIPLFIIPMKIPNEDGEDLDPKSEDSSEADRMRFVSMIDDMWKSEKLKILS